MEGKCNPEYSLLNFQDIASSTIPASEESFWVLSTNFGDVSIEKCLQTSIKLLYAVIIGILVVLLTKIECI